jgi:hypothetical protein
MNLSEIISAVELLLGKRGVGPFVMDLHEIKVEAGTSFYTSANQYGYFLVTADLPQGLRIVSETRALEVGVTQPVGLQEFFGQLEIHVPQGAAMDRLEFLRIILQKS